MTQGRAREERPAEVGDLERTLRDAVARSRALGRPIVVSRSRSLAIAPDALTLYSAAEQRGERRFLASCPTQPFARLGLGAAHEIAGEGHDRFAVIQRAAEGLFDEADLGACEETPGSTPLLVGGASFRPRPRAARDPAWEPFADARFTLPELTLSWRRGECELTWSLRVRPKDDAEQLARRLSARLEALLQAPRGESSLPIQLSRDSEFASAAAYRKSVREVVAAIQRGEAEKVVLARVERGRLSGPLPAAGVLRHLLRVHPTCVTFALGIGRNTFLGATPEQLVRRAGEEVVAAAVAGTVPRGESAHRLQDSPKERTEQRIVVDALAAGLREVCSGLSVPEKPSLCETGTVQHLRTVLRGKLSRPTHLLDLASRLHPTPAVCGAPRDRALDLISRHETFDRGWYAGLHGWFDPEGQGELFVSLRSGLLVPGEVSLFAGSGLVRDSEPEREAAETSLKLSSFREALEANCTL